VALYVRANLILQDFDELNSSQCESIWSKVYVNQKDFVIVGVCYRSPEAEDTETQHLFECIKLATAISQPIVIMGDFNYPGIDWVQLRSSDTGDKKFVNLVMDCFLDQHVCNPTRDNNILDLVLTNEVQIADEVKILPPLDNCDHNVLLWGIDCAADKALSNKAKLCFNRANYDDMRQFVGSRLCCMDFASMSESTPRSG